jgi:hypothetical protein
MVTAHMCHAIASRHDTQATQIRCPAPFARRTPRARRHAAHPELQEALTYALRHVASLGPARCDDPVQTVADKLLEFQARQTAAVHGGSAAAVAAARRSDSAEIAEAAEAPAAAVATVSLAPEPEASSAATCCDDAAVAPLAAEDAEEAALTASRQRAMAARGRRSVVFAEPVRCVLRARVVSYRRSRG